MGDSVLLTGGGGYVGSHLVRELLETGCRVRILDSFLFGAEGLAACRDHPNLEIRRGDICDASTLREAMTGIDTVVALAAIVGDAACELDYHRTVDTNYRSTLQTIAACRSAGVERLVFASSCSVYGANGDRWIHEKSELRPVSLYAKTRIMSEEALIGAARDFEVAILRLATVCGASRRMRFDLMVNTMTAHAVRRGKISVSGGKQWRPHLHVQDAARAFRIAASVPVQSGRIYNVGSDAQNFTIEDVARKVGEHVSGVDIVTSSDGADARSYRVSFGRIRDELGFVPRFTVDDAIVEVRKLLDGPAVEDHESGRYHNFRWLQSLWSASARELGVAAASGSPQQ